MKGYSKDSFSRLSRLFTNGNRYFELIAEHGSDGEFLTHIDSTRELDWFFGLRGAVRSGNADRVRMSIRRARNELVNDQHDFRLIECGLNTAVLNDNIESARVLIDQANEIGCNLAYWILYTGIYEAARHNNVEMIKLFALNAKFDFNADSCVALSGGHFGCNRLLSAIGNWVRQRESDPSCELVIP